MVNYLKRDYTDTDPTFPDEKDSHLYLKEIVEMLPESPSSAELEILEAISEMVIKLSESYYDFSMEDSVSIFTWIKDRWSSVILEEDKFYSAMSVLTFLENQADVEPWIIKEAGNLSNPEFKERILSTYKSSK